MHTIAEVADKIGAHICEQGEVKERFKEVAYGVEVILVVLITLAIINLCGAVLGLFWETFYASIAALVMRYIIGGSHLSGFSRCVGYSTVSIIFFAWMGVNQSEFLLSSASLLLFFLGIAGILIYAPLMKFDQKINDKSQIRLKKILAICLFGGSYFLMCFTQRTVYISIFAGLVFSIFNITSIGVLLVNFIEKTTNRKG